MTDEPEDSGRTVLDMADRKMLADIKASVLGTSRAELRIGRFRVLEQRGEGSMGIVFAAIDDQLQRRVAIKLLHQEVGASEGERKARLLREAQILAQLEHPNIVQVYEAGEHDGQVFMAMELVEGKALDELQRERPPGGWRTLLPLYVAAGHGLAAAHAQGVVHRDFKPHNVLVDRKGRVRVVDFGLARESMGAEQQLTAEIAVIDEGAIERPQGDHLTATGIVPGTPAYMAPELFDGQPASPASDQFSFCVALYEAVYGRRPFEGGRLQEVVAAAKHGRILPPVDRKVPRWLFEVLARGLVASPEARYPGMEALLEELERDRARRWKQAGVVVAASMVIGGTWWASGYTGDAAISRRHREACEEEAAELKALWETSKEGLARPPVEREDEDGLVTMLDADARGFFRQWDQACMGDVARVHEPCRTQVKRSFETALDLGKSNPLHESGFHELSYELALCVEGETSTRCAGPEAGSPAVVALGDARAAELTGDLVGAREHVERAIVLASEANDDHTQLAAMLRKGAFLESAGDLVAARDILDDVEVGALICRSDVLAIDAALELAEVETLHSGELATAERALAHVDTLLAMPEMQRMPLRLARALEKRGNAALLEHDCSEARAMFERTLELRNGVIEARAVEGLPTVYLERLAANAQLNLANVGLHMLANDPLARCRQPYGTTKDEILEQLRAAKDRMLRAVGNPLHPELAEFEFDLAILHTYSRDFEAAIEPLQAVLSIYVAQHGAQSPVVGDVHRALANAYGETGRLDRARQHAEANLDIRLLHHEDGGAPLALAEAYDILGLILHERKDPDGARANLTRAVDTLRKRSREALELNELKQLYWSERNLAGVELDRGEWAAVLRLSEQLSETRRALEKKFGKLLDPDEDLPQQRIIDAVVLLEDGKPREALARLEGIEGHPDYHPSLGSRIERVRERALAIK